VQAFASQYSFDTAKVLAFTSLPMIPALVFLSSFERRIVGGLTGAAKAELPGSTSRRPQPVETRTHDDQPAPARCVSEKIDQGGT
jgi:hypothetical protein